MNYISSTLVARHLSVGLAIALVLSLGALPGCGGSEDAPGDAPAPEATGTPADTAQAETGTGVKGTAKWNGPIPERAVLDTEGDPKCFALHMSDPLLSDREVINDDGGIQHVFVYVKNPPEGDHPVPAEPALLDQVGCTYIPHVMGVRAGQDITIKNSDETLHNVRAFARTNKPFNIGQPAGLAPRTKNFAEVEHAVRMKCDIHPWMSAFVFAMDHPFFATTGADGSFAIKDLPPGDYTLVAWHEKYGEQEFAATVIDGELTESTVTFAP